MVIKEKSYSNAPEVQWIGNRIPEVTVPQLENKDVYFYGKCLYGPQTLSVGDYVLVSNVDTAEPDTVAGCDVAKILYLYELRDMSERYPFRAIVQWYSRPKNIPHRFFDSDDIVIDFDLELFEEHRPYDSDISLESVFRKCSVICGSVDTLAVDILKDFLGKPNNCPMFVCRYKFVKVKNKYHIIPLQFSNEEIVDKCTIKSKTNNSGTPNISSRIPKKQGDAMGETRRRKSLSTANLMEFVDINDIQSENKVSPIKIVGGRSVVRMSSLSAKKQNAHSANKAEQNTNYLTASPLTEKNVKVTPTSRAAAARRNLNLSLEKMGNSTADSDCLNYSIVNTTPDPQNPVNDIKIKLRVSERRRSCRLHSQEEENELDPLAIEKCAEKLAVDYQRKRLGLIEGNNNNNNSSTPNNADIYSTPIKKSKESVENSDLTPSTRRKSILKSASRRLDGTPRRSIQLSNIVEKRVFEENEIISTPKRNRTASKRATQIDSEEDEEYTPPKKSVQKTPTRGRRSVTKTNHSSNTMTPTQKLKLIRAGDISPTIKERHHSGTERRKSQLQMAREQLHVSVVPKSLPCREKEYDNIYNFLLSKIEDQCGGCMYVSGVPGTGKTATVTSVIRTLQQEAAAEQMPAFEFLEINGMRLTEPRQAYVQIYKQLTGKTVSWEHAHSLLEKRFTTPAPRRMTTVLLVDELDILCNRRQDVVYNLLDWPTKSTARLVVVTIANTMDLPERLLMGKVTSRLGLTRLTFQPYTHKQLQEIVTARLNDSEAFKSEAVQLVARKVAAVSGDARRALDICRRATEVADVSGATSQQQQQPVAVTMAHVQQALGEMIASAKVQIVKSCSRLEQLFLQAVVSEVTRTGVEETVFMGVYTQMETIAAFLGITTPTTGQAMRICSKLGAQRLLICEHSRNDIFQKILLNISTDDVHYALRINHNNEDEL